MSYPEGLRNYQGPWPPPKDFLLSDNEIAFRSERRAWKGGLLLKTFVVAALIAIILPNINIHQIPVLRALFHVLGRVFPMIQGVGYYSHESLADVAGASILIGGIFLSLPGVLRTMMRIQALEGYSFLLRFIRTNNSPQSRWGYLFRLIMLLGFAPLFMLWIAWGDVEGYIALYVRHVSVHTLWTHLGAMGVLTGNGFNGGGHGIGVSFYLFDILRYRYGFLLFEMFYGASLLAATVGNALLVVFLVRIRPIACAIREDWRVLGVIARHRKRRDGAM